MKTKCEIVLNNNVKSLKTTQAFTLIILKRVLLTAAVIAVHLSGTIFAGGLVSICSSRKKGVMHMHLLLFFELLIMEI